MSSKLSYDELQAQQDRILAARIPLTPKEIESATTINITFTEDGPDGTYKGKSEHGTAFLIDRVAHTSGVHYRHITIPFPNSPANEQHVVVNEVPLRLKWNGYADRKGDGTLQLSLYGVILAPIEPVKIYMPTFLDSSEDIITNDPVEVSRVPIPSANIQEKEPAQSIPIIHCVFRVKNAMWAKAYRVYSVDIVLQRRNKSRPVVVLRTGRKGLPIVRVYAPDHDGSPIRINNFLVDLVRRRNRWQGLVSNRIATLWREGK